MRPDETQLERTLRLQWCYLSDGFFAPVAVYYLIKILIWCLTPSDTSEVDVWGDVVRYLVRKCRARASACLCFSLLPPRPHYHVRLPYRSFGVCAGFCCGNAGFLRYVYYCT